jgi:hypothetical protein
MRPDLCESAKHGHWCIDDLCHTGGETLCGFCQFDYDDVTEEPEYPPENQEPTYNDLRYES